MQKLYHFKLFFNTSASQCIVFEEKMNHFFLKMHKIWHMSFCMTILTKKCNKIFLLKLSYKKKTHVLNFMHFQEEMVHFFLKNKALRSEGVKVWTMTFKCMCRIFSEYLRETKNNYFTPRPLWSSNKKIIG